MDDSIMKTLPNFLSTLGLDEEPMGLFYTDEKPVEGFSPKESLIINLTFHGRFKTKKY